jgi:competence CoiA-like predicted nuclease
MPFVARDAVTHARIDITQLAHPREELRAADLICQICEERMIVRHGLIFRPHFAHMRACPVAYESHPESPEHLLGKAHMSAWLRQQPDFVGASVDLEVPIHARKRIADILVTFPQGHKLAVEIQLASITTEALHHRTEDYLNDGIDVVWVFGGNALRSPSNLAWCEHTLGGYLQLIFAPGGAEKTMELASVDRPAAPGDSAGSTNGAPWSRGPSMASRPGPGTA